MADKQATDCASAECDLDCAVSSWGKWTPCSAECAGGFRRRSRAILAFPAGSGKACPPDLNTASCNEGPCSASQRSVAPASSSHGFVSRLFHPRHSFESSQGEQAACVLDKTQAFIDLVVDVFKCTKWSGKVGEACYPLSGEHLVQHVEACCQGREHMVLWKSDRTCEQGIGEFVSLFTRVFLPHFKGCVSGQRRACNSLQSAAGQVTVASILRVGLTAAQVLYAGGHKHDMTEAAHAWLGICGVVTDKDLINQFAPQDCVKAVSAYLQQWRVGHEPAGDQRRLRGAGANK